MRLNEVENMRVFMRGSEECFYNFFSCLKCRANFGGGVECIRVSLEYHRMENKHSAARGCLHKSDQQASNQLRLAGWQADGQTDKHVQ